MKTLFSTKRNGGNVWQERNKIVPHYRVTGIIQTDAVIWTEQNKD